MKMIRKITLWCIGLTFVIQPIKAQAGLADIFVEIYDGVRSGAIKPAYETLKGYIVEEKLLSFLDELDLGDKELHQKYKHLIKSEEFDETYFPFMMYMLEKVGVLQKLLKTAEEGKIDSASGSFLQDPQKKEYLKTVLIVFGKLFLYQNGKDVASTAIHEQIQKLAQNPSLPDFVKSRLGKILEDPQKAMELYHFIGTLVQSIGQDYFYDFQHREVLRKAKLQWLETAGLEKTIHYFKASISKKRAVMMMVDGVGGQYLSELLSQSMLYPTLKAISNESVWVQKSVSSTPTISTRNIAILETGVMVSDPEFKKGVKNSTGIPNFTYVDRKKQEWMYFWGRDGIRLRELVKEACAKTLFEQLEPYHTVSFMAQFDTAADDRFSYLLGVVMMQIKPGLSEAIGLAHLKHRAQVEIELNHKRKKLAHYLERNAERWTNKLLWTERHYEDIAREILSTEDEGIPDFLLWYNPWVDHKTHEFGTHSKEVLETYLPKFDQDVSQIISLYKESGVYSKTLFGIISDHGQVNVNLPEGNINVEDRVIKPLTSRWKKISSDEGGPPKIDLVKSSIVGYDVVFGSTAGGSFVMDLFYRDAYDKEGNLVNPDRWAVHPTYEVLRNYELLSGEHVDWIAQIKTQLKDSLDYCLVREEVSQFGPGVHQVVRIIAPQGEARVIRAGDLYRYEVLEDSLTGKVEGDPLKLSEQSKEMASWIKEGSWHSDAEWLLASANIERLDAIHEISHIYDTQLAGTINIFPARGKGFNTGVPGRHAGELFQEKNSLQVYFGQNVTPGKIDIARGGSMPVTLTHYLMGDSYFSEVKSSFDFSSLLPALKLK